MLATPDREVNDSPSVDFASTNKSNVRNLLPTRLSFVGRAIFAAIVASLALMSMLWREKVDGCVSKRRVFEHHQNFVG